MRYSHDHRQSRQAEPVSKVVTPKFADNRKSTHAQLDQQKAMQLAATAQLKTTVNWSSQNFSYMDKDDSQVKTKEVGGTMTANLDPTEPIKGGDADSNFQKDMYDSLKHYWNPGSKSWVRGHLLNANLGGPNVAPNLFPITGHANGDHLNYVENHVKQWVIDGRHVTYSITATQNSGTVNVGTAQGVPNAEGSFLCYAETTDNDTKEKKSIHRQINSIPVKRNSPGGDSADPGHASTWGKAQTDSQGGAVLSLTQAQYTFLVELLDNSKSVEEAIILSNISELEIQELNAACEDATEDEQEADSESEKVGHRVTNAKLKHWLGKKLSNSEAASWLTTYGLGNNTYSKSSS